jgi:hypothetical protein
MKNVQKLTTAELQRVFGGKGKLVMVSPKGLFGKWLKKAFGK